MNTKQASTGRNIGLDIFRLICSLMVVCIHIGFPGHLGQAFIFVCRIAVPSFLLISGYFYNENTFSLKKTLCKLLPYILIGHLCFLAKLLILTPELLSETFSVHSFKNFILFNQPQWAEHLWYLNAIAYTYITIAIAHKLHWEKVLYFVTPLLLITNLILGEFSGILFHQSLPTYYSRNFLFFALPFFMIGRLIRKRNISITTIKRKVLCIGIGVFGLGISLIEYYFTRQKVDFMLGFLLMSTAAFLFFLYCNSTSKLLAVLADAGKKYTLFIYIMHPLIGIVTKTVAGRINFNAYPYFATPIVFIITLILAICWHRFYRSIKKMKLTR